MITAQLFLFLSAHVAEATRDIISLNDGHFQMSPHIIVKLVSSTQLTAWLKRLTFYHDKNVQYYHLSSTRGLSAVHLISVFVHIHL